MLRVVRGDDRCSWRILAGRLSRRIDPDGVRQDFEARRALYEALGMSRVGGQAGTQTDLERRGRAPVVDVGRCEIAQAAVMVRVVVPREQIVTDRAGVFHRSEAVGELGPVLQRAELRFRKGVVIADPRPRMTGLDAQIGEEQRDEFAPHRGAAVGMNRELLWADALFPARRVDETLRHAMSLAAPAADNQLTAKEKAAGWRLLFDGKTYAGWEDPARKSPLGNGFTIEDGCIKSLPHPNIDEDLFTLDTFRDFELEFDWKISPGGNSGVKYRIQERIMLADEVPGQVVVQHASSDLEQEVCPPPSATSASAAFDHALAHDVVDRRS